MLRCSRHPARMDDSPLMPGSEAFISLSNTHPDFVRVLIGTVVKIGWEVFPSQRGDDDRGAKVRFRDRTIDGAGYNESSTIKCRDHFHEDRLNRIYNRSCQVPKPPTSSKVSS
jgi:hypothetical protein